MLSWGRSRLSETQGVIQIRNEGIRVAISSQASRAYCDTFSSNGVYGVYEYEMVRRNSVIYAKRICVVIEQVPQSCAVVFLQIGVEQNLNFLDHEVLLAY